MSQIHSLSSRIDSLVPHDEPLLIGGDFNDWRGRLSKPLQQKVEVTEVFQKMHGAHARTFPSWLPALRLDRIYFRNMEPRAARTLDRAPWTQLSDHVALYAEFAI